VARDVGLGAWAPATVAAVGRSGEGAAAARIALCQREETAAWRLSFFGARERAREPETGDVPTLLPKGDEEGMDHGDSLACWGGDERGAPGQVAASRSS